MCLEIGARREQAETVVGEFARNETSLARSLECDGDIGLPA